MIRRWLRQKLNHKWNLEEGGEALPEIKLIENSIIVRT
jgi:hypothetical protein